MKLTSAFSPSDAGVETSSQDPWECSPRKLPTSNGDEATANKLSFPPKLLARLSRKTNEPLEPTASIQNHQA
ncbi:uncharacterized protein PGTG_22213 [Puccinia graminis f. sp. tritici CRL 75-36-700-3]|uniref:Uncharacterized protein n=1 Tax=Puccinia graminis f. sp. tritici (strain CRL 75-36-700-3 / race SCCL) TaxID=418459 RepID=H6QTS9_PUCGT|nr:uncharacterized protein PGTG_22213 [Puccinia graminis f. sp. tritici CRL 75-36-700-3]EHS64343.1 hypothetical protein PGTG_22213 [Puccinia graminis f. sp. tritici CRL 75-36-700-3]